MKTVKSASSVWGQLVVHPMFVALWSVLLVLSPVAVSRMRTDDYEPVLGDKSEAQEEHNTSAAARLIGEFRTSLSDAIFIKTEQYLHQGIRYDEHHGSGHAHPEGIIETMILTPLEDWRGFVGDLEREVKPWKDPRGGHIAHADPREVLPWFRIMTLINPHRLRGYRVGTFLLMTDGTYRGLGKALEFAREGVENNPQSHEMRYLELRVLIQLSEWHRRHDEPEKSEMYLQQALEATRHAVSLGGMHRPIGGWQPAHELDRRHAEQEQALVGAMYAQVQILRRLGQPQPALDAAREYLEFMGGVDPVLEDDIRQLTRELESNHTH